MKVIMFGWEFPPVISGGLGTACSGLTQGLNEKGIDIVFVVPKMRDSGETVPIRLIDGSRVPLARDDGDTTEETFRIKPVYSLLTPYMTSKSYQAHLTEALDDRETIGKDENPESWQLYGPDLYSEVLRYGQVARTLIRQEAWDLIHVHDWMTIPAGIEAKTVSGKPLVIHIHALESDRSGMHMDERIYGIERLGMLAADHVIAVSHYTKRKIVDQYGIPHEKISVVHNAVSRSESFARYHIRKDPSKRYVLFLGRMTLQKGPDYFLEAASRVLEKTGRIHFIMAGSGDMMPELVDKAAQLGIENHVDFTGFLRGNDVEKAYAISDLYVMPSVSEPFGITALEAISYDVPVIVSKQSGVSEVMRNCPSVDFWNVEELAHQIMDILGNKTLRDEIVKNCRDELKNINWKIAAEKIISVYENLLMI